MLQNIDGSIRYDTPGVRSQRGALPQHPRGFREGNVVGEYSPDAAHWRVLATPIGQVACTPPGLFGT